jgi:1,4-dihydroxy-6-naphthoate synthase
MKYGRGLARQQADRFVGMYVNDYTLDYGPAGRQAIDLFLRRGAAAGVIPHQVEVEFAA